MAIYRPSTQQTQRSTIPGTPHAIVFERGNTSDALVHSTAGWSRVSRSGNVSPLIGGAPPTSALVLPSTLDDVYRKFPALRNQLLFLLREQQPNRAVSSSIVLSGALAADRASEAWLGTSNDGL